jgi:hypothetical protein
MTAQRAELPLEDPQGKLERAFIDEYLRNQGKDLRTLHELPAEQIRSLLKEAATYAAGRLAEVEARASYVHELHGAAEPSSQ